MTEKEYLKIICELSMIAAESIGLMQSADMLDDWMDIPRFRIITANVVKRLNEQLNSTLDKLNEEHNQ